MQQSYQRQALPGVPTNEPGPQWNIRVPTQPAEAPNRTTARPIYRAAYYQPVSARPSTSYNPAGLDDSGWRPARD
jgi:hypothetical protein